MVKQSPLWRAFSISLAFLIFTACTTLRASAPENTEAPLPQAKVLKIIALSDINSGLGSTTYNSSVKMALQRMTEEKPDVIIGVGDYVAGEDIRHRFPLSRFHEMWASFKLNILDEILGEKIELAPTPGNHDASGYPLMKRERGIYIDFWNRHKPRLEYINDRHYPLYYSYKVDDVFFISMDDVTPFRIHHGDEQRQWIKEQLASEEAQHARARIVYGHVPLYPLLDKDKYSRGNRGKYYEVLNKEQWEESSEGLEKIFLDHNVSLAVFAHSHAFFPGKVVHRREGETRQLRILSMPCLGSGSRYLAGEESRSPTGYAVITVGANGEIDTTGITYQGNVIDKNDLPDRIIVPGKFNRYFRDDVTPTKEDFPEED